MQRYDYFMQSKKYSLSLWKRKGYMDFIFILIVAIFFISLLYIAIKAIVEWCTKNDFTPMGWH